jgi:YegS/Rv2252/BmrU family lipid kinase
VSSVAVVAHAKKTLGGGLVELRQLLEAEGVTAPIWYEVPKSKKAKAVVRSALDAGADLIFVWGGDGMVQRCVDVVSGTGSALAIIPAGTANLFATNVGIPRDIERAVQIGLHGRRRRFDVGVVNGERFVVMAGAGFDARMINAADGALKDRAGKLAYVLTGARSLNGPRVRAVIEVDGKKWFRGKTSCVLVGNVGRIAGGVQVFEHARPDDGELDLGVVTARGVVQWAGVVARLVAGRAARSRFVQLTRGKKINVKFDRPLLYELDGGARGTSKKLKIRVEPAAIEICVPDDPS